ncbi:hypothetical protein BVC80_1815g72 [Macleaya cordata]|uniref:Uncharacterized protein n=1 Tax=Macleaya cordata TaxID=56857 RepID=A0A200QW70_MACCD|nr:hypothetical protein BVC80_1815g72 [Macleaya cordata]
MCGLCCSKTKEKNINEGKRGEAEAVPAAPSVHTLSAEAFEEEPMQENSLGSKEEEGYYDNHQMMKEEQKKMKEEQKKKMMNSESMENNKTDHEVDDQGMKKKNSTLKQVQKLSERFDFPSTNPKVKDKLGIPNMKDFKKTEEKSTSEDKEILDDREFPWTSPPAIENLKQEEEEEEEEENEDEREFPLNAPKVDDKGTSFPYDKPPKTVEKKRE